MSKPARGTKRVCASCGARFYDLSRTPITCPACQAVYQIAPPPSRRGERAQPVELRKVVVEPEVEAVVPEVAEVISLEEVEEAGAEPPSRRMRRSSISATMRPRFRQETTTTPFSKKKRKARPTSRALSGHRAKRPEVRQSEAKSRTLEAPLRWA